MASFPAADGAFRVSDLNPHPIRLPKKIVPGAELNDVVVSSGRLSDGAAFVSSRGEQQFGRGVLPDIEVPGVFERARHSSEKRFCRIAPGDSTLPHPSTGWSIRN